MKNNITKKLIILFGAVIFSLTMANSVSASSDCIIRDFKANGSTSLTVNSGDLVTLSWNTNNCRSIKLSGHDVNTEVTQNGYFNINPTVSSSYTINATATGFYPYQYQVIKISVIPSITPDVSVMAIQNPNQYNYYYNNTKSPATTSTTKTISDTSTTKATDKTESKVDTSTNNLTALSLRGSGGFMPSSIWQWILVVILILAIIIIARMFIHKPDPTNHDTH